MSAGGRYADHDEAFAAVLAVARRELLLLVIAAGAADLDGASIASARLQWALASARQLVELLGTDSYHRRRARLGAVSDLANQWLAAANPPPVTAETIERFVARTITMVGGREPGICANTLELQDLDLDELNLVRISMTAASLTGITARRAILDAADLAAARLLQCDLEACTIARASLNEAALEGCNLAHADLECSSLVRVTASRCGFQGATLVDTWLDGALFSDCDFRDANLEVTRPARTAGTTGARFVRCDLRYTSWRGRDLAGASFIDCKLYGAHGDPTPTEPQFERPDLSRAADGSQIGARSDVLGAWGTVVRPREDPMI